MAHHVPHVCCSIPVMQTSQLYGARLAVHCSSWMPALRVNSGEMFYYEMLYWLELQPRTPRCYLPRYSALFFRVCYTLLKSIAPPCVRVADFSLISTVVYLFTSSVSRMKEVKSIDVRAWGEGALVACVWANGACSVWKYF